MYILSIVSNSAMTKQIFSKIEIIHSKLHSQMSPKKVYITVFISEDITKKFPWPIHCKWSFGDLENETAERDSKSPGSLDPLMDLLDSDYNTIPIPEITFAAIAADFTDNLQNANTNLNLYVSIRTAYSFSSTSASNPATSSLRLGVQSLELQYLFKAFSAEDYHTRLWRYGWENLGVELHFYEMECSHPTLSEDIGATSVASTFPILWPLSICSFCSQLLAMLCK